jgi:multisubunit Na+/H+ antiporter MnhG subunit
MNEADQAPSEGHPKNIFSLVLIGILVQAGCLTFFLVGAAIILGLWLDSRFNTRPLLTIMLVLASVPVTMYLLYRVAVTGASRLQRRSVAEEVLKRVSEGEHGKNA